MTSLTPNSQLSTPMNQPTRAEHLQWCKDRALEYVELGELETAIASMISDLKKHPATTIDHRIERALLIPILFHQTDKTAITKWIQGFN